MVAADAAVVNAAATPMLPKNGLSGPSMPGANVASSAAFHLMMRPLTGMTSFPEGTRDNRCILQIARSIERIRTSARRRRGAGDADGSVQDCCAFPGPSPRQRFFLRDASI